MKSTLLNIAIAAFLLTGLVSCKDDKEDPKPSTGLTVSGTVNGAAWNGTGTIKGEDNVTISRTGYFVSNDTLGILSFSVNGADTSFIMVAKIVASKAFNGSANVVTDTSTTAFFAGQAGFGAMSEGTISISNYSATGTTIDANLNGKFTMLFGTTTEMIVNNLVLKNIPKYAFKPSELNQD